MNQEEYNKYQYKVKKVNPFVGIFGKIFMFVFKEFLSLFVRLVVYGGIIFFIMILVLIGSNDAPKVIQSGYLVLAFPHGISDTPPSFFIRDKVGLYDVLNSIESAKDDDNVKGIVINLDQCFVSSENAHEINEKIEYFKKSGKKVYAYGTYINNSTYRMALKADQIVMPPSASTLLSLTGYHRDFPYFKNAGDKFGVKFTVVHIGDYKAFGENYVKDKMSEEFRGEVTRVYDKDFENFITDVSVSRNVDREILKEKIDKGELAFVNSYEAQKQKLIDRLSTFNELIKELNFSSEEATINLSIYSTLKKRNAFLDSSTSNKIALIFAEGDILMSESDSDGRENDIFITPGKLIKSLDKAADDKSVKGIVLRVNSPGGSALASEIIAREIDKVRVKKPIYVSMGNVAASGGYYIASNTNKIFAEKSTITGSIGVVALFPSFKGLTDKVGVNFESVKRGVLSDFGNPFKDTSQQEIDVLRNSMLLTYEEFKSRVYNGRKNTFKSLDEVEKIAQGKIWTGEEAKKVGLVDEIGSLNDTIAKLAKDKGISNYVVVPYVREANFMDKLRYEFYRNLTSTEESSFLSKLQEYDGVKELVDNSKRIKTYGNKPLILLPFDISIK